MIGPVAAALVVSLAGQEPFARAIQRSKRGLLVGERTAGADGERLEGVGVTPDVSVPFSLPSSQGKDPQLERALELAAKGVE